MHSSVSQKGFTIIELVITSILITILAVVAIPRLFNAADFSHLTTRDHLISLLRESQLRALNDHSACYSVLFSGSANYGIPVNCASALGSNSLSFPVEDGLTISIGGGENVSVIFDTLGRPSGGNCAGGCTISVAGDATVQVCLEREGYIHACP